ncbi:MAG: hypothetical protein HQ463_05545 [Bacteroidetes bacterium]|nr:hypothetical protein [Bacteroidota bacterium]
MIASQYLNTVLKPFEINTTVKQAKEILLSERVNMLPLVENNTLLNYIGIEQLEYFKPTDVLKNISLYAPYLPFVLPNQHIFDALKQLKMLELPLLAVQTEEGKYEGILKTSDIVKTLSQSLSIGSVGSIIVLKVKPIDYSLADMSRIIEYNDAKIIGVVTYEIENAMELEVHLKLNTTILKNILATLERYNYQVTQYFGREDRIGDLDERYESLMKFLDI